MHLVEHEHGDRQRHTTTDQQRGGDQQDRPQRAERQAHQQQHRRQRAPADGVDLLVGLHGGRFGMQRHAGMQDLQIRRSGLGRLSGAFEQAIEMALAIKPESRARRIELQRRPVLALGLQQAVIAQAQPGALGLLLPPLRPQRQRILPPLGQARRAHRSVQRTQRLFGQGSGFGLLQLLALGRGQQAVAVRCIERTRVIEPAFDRTTGHQQRAVGITGHCRSERCLRALGGGTVGAAEQHHHLPRAAIGDAPGDVAEQTVVRVLRQQGEDVGIDP
ncbi:hypothetical protein SRABI89_05549 [Pseudomonas koreensis]|nr:hypothetical protein SRABI89_05549 [Pseudomonas koreensis]